MLGLPTETDEDVDWALPTWPRKGAGSVISAVPKERRAPGLRIVVSASVFVPQARHALPVEPAIGRRNNVIRRQQRLKAQALRKIRGVDLQISRPGHRATSRRFSPGVTGAPPTRWSGRGNWAVGSTDGTTSSNMTNGCRPLKRPGWIRTFTPPRASGLWTRCCPGITSTAAVTKEFLHSGISEGAEGTN